MHPKTTHNCAPACQSVCQSVLLWPGLAWSDRSIRCIPRRLPPEEVEKMRTRRTESGTDRACLSRDRQNLVITLMLLVKQRNCFPERTLKVSDLFPSQCIPWHNILSRSGMGMLRNLPMYSTRRDAELGSWPGRVGNSSSSSSSSSSSGGDYATSAT